MKTEQIVMCVVALLLGMLLFHMLKGVCGCKVVEGMGCKPKKNLASHYNACAPRDQDLCTSYPYTNACIWDTYWDGVPNEDTIQDMIDWYAASGLHTINHDQARDALMTIYRFKGGT